MIGKAPTCNAMRCCLPGSMRRNIHEDQASGARDDRPGLKLCLEFLRPGDILIVWKLDRLGRSLPHLIEIVSGLRERGVGFRSLTEVHRYDDGDGGVSVSRLRGSGPV